MRKLLEWAKSTPERGIVVGLLLGITIGEILKLVF